MMWGLLVVIASWWAPNNEGASVKLLVGSMKLTFSSMERVIKRLRVSLIRFWWKQLYRHKIKEPSLEQYWMHPPEYLVPEFTNVYSWCYRNCREEDFLKIMWRKEERRVLVFMIFKGEPCTKSLREKSAISNMLAIHRHGLISPTVDVSHAANIGVFLCCNMWLQT